MNLPPLNTIAQIQAYIDRHTTALGFPPTAVGVPVLRWEPLKEEFKSMQRYTEANPVPVTEFYVGNTRVIPNSFMRDTE